MCFKSKQSANNECLRKKSRQPKLDKLNPELTLPPINAASLRGGKNKSLLKPSSQATSKKVSPAKYNFAAAQQKQQNINVLITEQRYTLKNLLQPAKEIKQRSHEKQDQPAYRVSHSFCVSVILEYLTQAERFKLQQLSRFFYRVQMPRCSRPIEITLKQTKLHLLNQDYLVTFDVLKMTKSKQRLRDEGFRTLWNQQSIQVRGKIYMCGGAIANTKTYLKNCSVLDETKMQFESLADMNYQRDAHGITSWKNRYIIVVGSWHGVDSSKTCEIYDVQTNKWSMLPPLNDGTCAPGLLVMQNRFLYKLGGTSDIGKVEMLDLEYPTKWISINTTNKFGRKHTINRCLLWQLPKPSIFSDSHTSSKGSLSTASSESNSDYVDDGKFLVLGCHFGRSEKPFIYDVSKNKYQSFQDKDVFIDMYRSNDIVQFDRHSIFIRPFVKVGEKAENVKVFQYYLEDIRVAQEEEKEVKLANIRSSSYQNQEYSKVKMASKEASYNTPETNIRRSSITKSQAQSSKSGGGLFSRVANLFSKKTNIQAPKEIKKGTFQEVTFRTTVWDADSDDPGEDYANLQQ